jgi:hypothetical protein
MEELLHASAVTLKICALYSKQAKGYRVIPVNPAAEGKIILGEHCYKDLKSIPKEIQIDMVDCFRGGEHIPPIAEDAVAIGMSRQSHFQPRIHCHFRHAGRPAPLSRAANARQSSDTTRRHLSIMKSP